MIDLRRHGLTRFILDMLGGRLPSRDPSRLAETYRINPAHARGYLMQGGE